MLTEQEEDGLRALLSPAAVDERRRLRGLLDDEAKIRALLAEARTIGAQSLLRRLFVKVYEGETTVLLNNGTYITIEEAAADDMIHYYYLADVHPDATGVNVNHGYPHNPSGDAFLGNEFYWHILKDRLASPARMRAQILLANSTLADVTVFVKVYRVAGLT